MRKPIWHRAFLVALEQHDGNVTLAASRVGRHRSRVYEARQIHKDFATEWDAVIAKLGANLCQHVDRRSRHYA